MGREGEGGGGVGKRERREEECLVLEHGNFGGYLGDFFFYPSRGKVQKKGDFGVIANQFFFFFSFSC